LETAEPLPDMLARKSSFLEEFHEWILARIPSPKGDTRNCGLWPKW
jgi:hypothetical protein